MTYPQVSVLMPAYNHARYVRQAIQSVLDQTVKDIELIVIDDASSDDTWSVITSVTDSRIRAYRHSTNAGAHVTLNEALGLACGDFVAVLNSDDIYSSGRLGCLLAALTELDGAEGLAFSDVTFIDQTGLQIPEHPRAERYRAYREYCGGLSMTGCFLAGNAAISTSNFVMQRSLAQALNGFSRLRYTHDWEFVIRAMSNGARVLWIREPLLQYRVHANNTLAEDDSWRHIHENSYVQSLALNSLARNRSVSDRAIESAAVSLKSPLGLSLKPSAPFDKLRASHQVSGDQLNKEHELLMALLSNESLHPISLLCYLALGSAGASMQYLLDSTDLNGENSLLAVLARVTGLPPVLFRSVGDLCVLVSQTGLQAKQIAEQNTVIQEQLTVIQEQNAVIQERNAAIQEQTSCIAGQATLIDERWDAMQEMGIEIFNRDQRIGKLEAELSAINARLVVRILKRLKSPLPRLVPSSCDDRSK